MIATLINFIAIVFGGLLGMVLKKGLPDGMRKLFMQANGICVLVIGIKMALTSPNDVAIVVSLVIGSAIGYALKLDEKLNQLGYGLKKLVKIQDSDFIDGFVSASLIFCIGAMAIVGSFEAALNHNYDVLYVKASLDGIMAAILASTMGIGIVFAALSVLIYQGLLTFIAALLEPFLTDNVISYLTATGGVLIMAIGISVAGIKEIKTINYLPSMIVAAVFGYFL